MMIRKAWRTVDYSVLQAFWLHSTTEKYISRSDNAHRCVRCKILIYFPLSVQKLEIQDLGRWALVNVIKIVKTFFFKRLFHRYNISNG